MSKCQIERLTGPYKKPEDKAQPGFHHPRGWDHPSLREPEREQNADDDSSGI
jgi:hypothetical protein